LLHCTRSKTVVKRLPPFGSLQAFVQVARLGSLKAAADSLALSSPALTRRIQSLEQFVGAPLFERAHNTVVPNERAQALLEDIEPHLDSIAIAIERATDSPKAMRIRIAVPSLFASQRLMPALPSLRQRQPNLVIDVDTGANRISRLGEGVDAAIAITDEISDQRHYTRMLERGRIVALGSRSLLSNDGLLLQPKRLREMPVLLHRDMPNAFDAWKDALGYLDLEPPHISYYDAGQLILDAAAEGLGVAFMMESHLESSSDSRLVRMFSGSAVSPYAYWFACPPSALQRRGVRIFHDWLFDVFGEAEEEVAPAGVIEGRVSLTD
jgi:LysR family transcriptional regulator, glycine cleavage system transcriptional activator